MPAETPVIHRDPLRGMRRLRLLSAIGLAIVLPLFVLSGLQHVHLLVHAGWFARLDGGTFDVGYEVDPRAHADWYLRFDDYVVSAGASAWRPFRTAGSYGFAFIFPLWQPLILCTALLAYSHGDLRGSRRGDPSRCPDCGYSLRGLPTVGGYRTCPECGRAESLQAAG